MEKEQENKKKKIILIVTILCICLLGITVAYTVLSTALNITFGSIKQNSLTWNVGFEPGIVSGTKTGAAGVICGDATVTADTVSVANTTLTTLHDKCVYSLKVKNTGTIEAILSSIASKTPTSTSCDTTTTSRMICGNITYKLTTDQAGTSLLALNNVLVASTGTLDVYLTAEYTGTSTGTSSEQRNGGFTLNYTQH